MGRHSDAAGTSRALRRAALVAGLVGGLAWAGTALVGQGVLRDLLVWVGAALVTIALLVLGLLLVKSDVLVLRVFVALALPILVWGVVALLRDQVSTGLVDLVFGGAVALISAVQLARRRVTPLGA